MLLLVLILVLIAFGLLIVALLTGGVLWAWVSVGVSVAAAAVLLVDWLQRRSAVRAAEVADTGANPTVVPEVEPGDTPPRAPVAELGGDTATEVFPVVRANGPVEQGAAPLGGRHDERSDARETAVLHGLPPSGSAGQPPGARGGMGAEGPFSSQSVTSDRGDPYAGGGHAGYSEPAVQETVRVPGAGGPGPTDPHGGPGRGAPEGVPAGGGSAHELPPLGPDGAPPEEPHDPEAAAVVAGLDDEVFVVDELPRYHVAGCRSLAGSAVIPLPVREAVELGFTPCAWCAPDRTLSGRHRASMR